MQTGRESCFAWRFFDKNKETKEEEKKDIQFFVMHLFSVSFKQIYEDALSGIDYFDTLYIRTMHF